MPSAAEKLAEARRLAALLSVCGHAEARARLLEILDNPMEDVARLEMLRYEASALLCDLSPHDPLVRRLRALTEG